MNTMRRTGALVALLLVPLTGCGPAHPTTAQPSGAPTSAAPTSSASTATTPPAPPPTPDNGPPGLLAALRTEHFTDHDRVAFQFHGSTVPKPYLRYVDRVTADPSDRPVPLAGTAFVQIAFHGGRLDTTPVEPDPAKARKYTGPTRLAPGYPLLKELAVSGDFEAVLSFGLGLSAVAGVSTSTSGGTLTLDLWRTAPGTMLWPITSVSQAHAAQDEVNAGHQPWKRDPALVAQSYSDSVLHLSGPVRRLGPNVYQIEAGTRVAVITLSQPLGQPDTVWTVASVVDSKR
jgi:hypothetical protein